MIKVWILTVIFAGHGVTAEKYNFKNREECLQASNFYKALKSELMIATHVSCYPSYIPSK